MTIRNAARSRTQLALAVALAAVSASESFAQELFIEEILVTARKQTESLQDVPLALTAIDTGLIDQLGIATTEDVIKLNPGLTFSKGIGGQDVRPDIRGLTALSGRSNIAILVDGVDQTTDALTGTGAGQLISMGLYDLQRVEIVRGPQSALFGRNAFGGAINYITKKPSNTFEGEISGEIAEYETYKGKLGLTGPLTDNVLYRLNISHAETGGQYDHPTSGADLGDDETDAISLALQFLPTDSLEILTRLDWAEQERSEQAVMVAPFNSCLDRTTGTTSSGACTHDANNSPLFLGELTSVGEEDIKLSEEGVPGNKNDLMQFTALINYEIGDYTLTSNTSYTKAEGEDTFDLDYQSTVDSFQPGSLASLSFGWVSPANPFSYIADTVFERDVVFQDFRFSFDDGGDTRWLVGLEYYSEEYDQDNYGRANGVTLDRSASPTATGALLSAVEVDVAGIFGSTFTANDTTVTGTLPANEYRETESIGIYGSYDWSFAENWELSLSARYQEETVDIEYDNINRTQVVPGYDDQYEAAILAQEGRASGTWVGLPFFLNTPPGCAAGSLGPSGFVCSFDPPTSLYPKGRKTTGSEDFDAFNPRVVLTHFLNDDVMMYAAVAKGTKPGGFNFEANLLPENRVYDQEELTAYELGWKTSWYNDRMTVNGALFYNDNTDKQANDRQNSTPPFSYVNNIGEIVSQGVELQLTAILTEGLRMDISYAYTETEVKEFTDNTIPPTEIDGKRLPRSPLHAGLLTFQYDWLVDNMSWFMRADTSYRSKTQVSEDSSVQLKAKTTVDLRLGVVEDDWEISAYLDNAFNNKTPSNAVDFVNFQQNFQSLVIAFPADKRTAGIRAKYSF